MWRCGPPHAPLRREGGKIDDDEDISDEEDTSPEGLAMPPPPKSEVAADHEAKKEKVKITRYADDFVVMITEDEEGPVNETHTPVATRLAMPPPSEPMVKRLAMPHPSETGGIQ